MASCWLETTAASLFPNQQDCCHRLVRSGAERVDMVLHIVLSTHSMSAYSTLALDGAYKYKIYKISSSGRNGRGRRASNSASSESDYPQPLTEHDHSSGLTLGLLILVGLTKSSPPAATGIAKGRRARRPSSAPHSQTGSSKFGNAVSGWPGVRGSQGAARREKRNHRKS